MPGCTTHIIVEKFQNIAGKNVAQEFLRPTVNPKPRMQPHTRGRSFAQQTPFTQCLHTLLNMRCTSPHHHTTNVNATVSHKSTLHQRQRCCCAGSIFFLRHTFRQLKKCGGGGAWRGVCGCVCGGGGSRETGDATESCTWVSATTAMTMPMLRPAWHGGKEHWINTLALFAHLPLPCWAQRCTICLQTKTLVAHPP